MSVSCSATRQGSGLTSTWHDIKSSARLYRGPTCGHFVAARWTTAAQPTDCRYHGSPLLDAGRCSPGFPHHVTMMSHGHLLRVTASACVINSPVLGGQSLVNTRVLPTRRHLQQESVTLPSPLQTLLSSFTYKRRSKCPNVQSAVWSVPGQSSVSSQSRVCLTL